MRLVSYLDGGSDRLGIERDGRVISAEHLVSNGPRTMAALLDEGPGMLARLRLASDAPWPDTGSSVDDLTLLSPVPRPSKIIAVAVNYQDHAAEGGRKAPEAPVLFAKFPSSLVGHRSDIVWDRSLTQAVDYEAELAVVIGRQARDITADEAIDHVLGYACLNDVSARDLQFGDKQFVRGKSLDTFCPVGPALVTADDIDDPQQLRIRCLVNGEVRQEATTGDMVHGVADVISFCSRAFTLLPGDIIATGTPSGVGWYREPRALLSDGDEVTVEIQGVGRLVNRCREVRSDA